MHRITFHSIFRIFLIVAFWMVLVETAVPVSAQPASDKLSEKVDAYITETMRRLPIPGLAVGIVKGDQILYLHGYGIANTNGDPVTPQTPFMLGSVTKTFTALAIHQLVSAGKIDFDEPVQTYIPEFRLADPHASASITVGQLFEHTSAISTNEGEAPYIDSPRTTFAEAIHKLAGFKPKYEPGEHYEYSNWNYILLAEIISRTSGRPYTEYVQKNILQPLQMTRASFADYHTLPGSATGNLITFGVSIPYDEKYVPIYVGAGYLTASAEEMTHYLIAYLKRGQYADHRLLPDPGQGWYDFSWNRQVGQPEEAYDSFSGGMNSIQTNITLFHNVGVVVLMNTRLEQLAPAAPGAWDIALDLARITTETPYTLPSNRGFYGTWALVDSFFLLMIVSIAWQVFKLKNWKIQFRDATPARRIVAWLGLLLDFLICIGVLALPSLANSRWNILLHYRPDFSIPLLIIGLSLGALGLIKTLLLSIKISSGRYSMLKNVFVLFLATILLSGMACTPAQDSSSPILSESIADIIEEKRPEIRAHMREENVSGLAVAVVDDKGILWAEGFGTTDWDQRIPVTPNTLFSIQSMSKSFTATAAMFAAQDGLVDLDEPITTYLPGFHVNSIFEEHPEQEITLRMLLSHTAGFVHEAPYGGNYDHPAYSFEKHIASISDTWLKFPVGTRYSYSNLGIDLAGYILQVRSGIPFVQYVQEKVLDPLGMQDSTLDVNQIRRTPTRAIGHQTGQLFPPPVDFLIIPSGGVWTTAADMARYLQFHINKGALGESRLLREDLAETMYTPPNVPAHYYALGVVRTPDHGTRRFEHGGGGFGFNSDMIWYPELKLGAVVLCNAQLESDLVVRLNQEILNSIIASASDIYAERAKSGVPVEPAYPPDVNGTTLSDSALQKLVVSKALPEEAATVKRRNAFVGTYMILGLGDTAEVRDDNGRLTISYWDHIEPLTEVQPGLYFSPYGDAVDFRGRIPTYSNIRLIKIDTRTGLRYVAFYAICALVFLSAVLYWPLRALMRQRPSGSVRAAALQAPLGPWQIWAGTLAALASLFSLLCLAFIAFLPDMVYMLASLPWLRPYADLLWWQFALLSLPFVSLLLAVLIALLAGPVMRGHPWRGTLRPYYLIVALVLLVFHLTIIL